MANKPMILTVSFRNHRGIDVAVPQDIVRRGDPPSLREGFSIRLFRSLDHKAGRPTQAQRGANGAEEPWTEIRPARRPVHHESSATRTLNPTESAMVLKVDLGEFFLVSKPASYRVELHTQALRGDDSKPGVLAATFTIAP